MMTSFCGCSVPFLSSIVVLFYLSLPSFSSCAVPISLSISTVDSPSIGIGRSVLVGMKVSGGFSPSALLWPFVNESQWGASPPIGDDGYQYLPIPIPVVGTARIRVAISLSPPAGPYYVGTSLSLYQNVTLSNEINITVNERVIARPDPNRNFHVSMEWEPWFTPLNFDWRGPTESIPILGKYDSYNPMVMMQHCIWLAESGIDTLMVDWTNNLWNTPHWNDRNPNVQNLVNATTRTLEMYTYLRRQQLSPSIPTPKMILLLGLDNGVDAPEQAINEEIEFVWTSYVTNSSLDPDLWLQYEGKPLIVVFDGGNEHSKMPPLNNTHFTIRWMASQLQSNNFQKQGFWSWMDGSLAPIPTMYNNSVEALTVTPAFFGDGGWLYPQAYARHGGTVFVEQFKTAAQYPPKFLIINQWNEFAGQANGQGYGPNHDIYTDDYSLSLSDDIEPTSIPICAYPRPNQKCGGYGFFYLNLLTALVDVHTKGKDVDFTVLTVGYPEPNDIINTTSVNVTWNMIGVMPKSNVEIFIDTKLVASVSPKQVQTNIDLKGYQNGVYTLTVVASGARTPYALSYWEVDEYDEIMLPPTISMTFTLDV